MKSIIILAALVATVIALPGPPSGTINPSVPADIIESEFKKEPDNSYNYHYKTSNGIEVQAKGELKEVVGEDKKPQMVVVVRGSYSYTDTEGKPVNVAYIADEAGYHLEKEFVASKA